MKNIKNLFTVALLFALIAGFSSCSTDNDNYWVAIGTYRALENNHFYIEFEEDNQIQKMYPGEVSNLNLRDIEDGQSVYVYYDLLKEDEPGYDLNAKIYALVNILTKDIIPLTEATEDSIGNAAINIVDSKISLNDEFLHISFQYRYDPYSSIRHMLNMVIPEEGVDQTPDGEFINLEFRHNDNGDYGNDIAFGYVTFRLREIADEMKTKKGIRIKYKSINEGSKTVEILFDGDSSDKIIRDVKTPSVY
ncbi:MAG: NigD-like C-terminal domain-containing protein [Bacteroides sp.]|nr:NigD-like C-terminal domain-containing protein [Bacteroides sp.]MDD4055685.1 NigD-like C-terminal domain-containing protein [Bacteroides sp.]MDD4720794.1 NigD-like C-terminal domain-containing protein [Bacteroides sp.]